MVDLSKSTDFKTVETSNKKTQIILAESKRSAKNYINSLGLGLNLYKLTTQQLSRPIQLDWL